MQAQGPIRKRVVDKGYPVWPSELGPVIGIGLSLVFPFPFLPTRITPYAVQMVTNACQISESLPGLKAWSLLPIQLVVKLIISIPPWHGAREASRKQSDSKYGVLSTSEMVGTVGHLYTGNQCNLGTRPERHDRTDYDIVQSPDRRCYSFSLYDWIHDRDEVRDSSDLPRPDSHHLPRTGYFVFVRRTLWSYVCLLTDYLRM